MKEKDYLALLAKREIQPTAIRILVLQAMLKACLLYTSRETIVFPKRSSILTFFDYLYQLAEILRIHISDIANTECVRCV